MRALFPLAVASFLIVALASAPPVAAQTCDQILMHFVGFAVETGGFPPSEPTDELGICGRVDGIMPPLTWDPAAHSYPIVVDGLVSNGQTEVAGNIVVTYTGGRMTIHEGDPGAECGEGSVYITGELTGFTLYYNTQFNSGAFESNIDFDGGDHLHELGSRTSGYTFGAGFVFGSPEEYDLQLDALVCLPQPVAMRASTWGRLKSIYGARPPTIDIHR